MSEHLLPCPFCGGSHIEVMQSFDEPPYLPSAVCSCGANVGLCGHEEAAIAAWNRRAVPQETETPITEDAIVQLGFVHNNGTLYRLPTSNPACAVIATFFPNVPCVVTIMNHHGDATIWLPTITTMERLRMLVTALSTE